MQRKSKKLLSLAVLFIFMANIFQGMFGTDIEAVSPQVGVKYTMESMDRVHGGVIENGKISRFQLKNGSETIYAYCLDRETSTGQGIEYKTEALSAMGNYFKDPEQYARKEEFLKAIVEISERKLGETANEQEKNSIVMGTQRLIWSIVHSDNMELDLSKELKYQLSDDSSNPRITFEEKDRKDLLIRLKGYRARLVPWYGYGQRGAIKSYSVMEHIDKGILLTQKPQWTSRKEWYSIFLEKYAVDGKRNLLMPLWQIGQKFYTGSDWVSDKHVRFYLQSSSERWAEYYHAIKKEALEQAKQNQVKETGNLKLEWKNWEITTDGGWKISGQVKAADISHTILAEDGKKAKLYLEKTGMAGTSDFREYEHSLEYKNNNVWDFTITLKKEEVEELRKEGQKLKLHVKAVTGNEWETAIAGLVSVTGGRGKHQNLITTQKVKVDKQIETQVDVELPTDNREIEVTKTWVGKQGKQAIFELYADGKKLENKTLTLQADSWTGKFTGLPVYNKEGKEIAYQVKEQGENNGKITLDDMVYTVKQIQDGDKFHVINISQETVAFPVAKEWVGKTGVKAVVALYQMTGTEEKEIARVELTDQNQWKANFNPQPKYDQNTGNEIKYDIKEIEVTSEYNNGQAPQVVWKDINGVRTATFTNINTETVEVTVKKTWTGGEHVRPDRIFVSLTAEPSLEEVLGSAEKAAQYQKQEITKESWTKTFHDLPKYYKEKLVSYGVIEEKLSQFTPEITSITKDNKENCTIVLNNRYETSETVITVNKKWINTPLAEQISATFQLKRSVQGREPEKVGEEITLTAENDWAHIFQNLPEKDVEGNVYHYTVEETKVNGKLLAESGYLSTVSGDKAFEITNTNEEKTSLEVTKKWKDGLESSYTAVKVELLAEGVDINNLVAQDYQKIQELSQATSWKAVYQDLPKYYEGKRIVYTVKEISSTPNFASFIGKTEIGPEKESVVVTNAYATPKTSIIIHKVWVNTPSEAQNFAEFELWRKVKAEEHAEPEKIQDFILSAEKGWSVEIKDLEKTNEKGLDFEYFVKEVGINGKKDTTGYNIRIAPQENDVIVVTNVNEEKIHLEVEKIWEIVSESAKTEVEVVLEAKIDNNILEEATLNALLAEGYQKARQLNAENSWQTIYEDLPKYFEGRRIVYTVKETTELENFHLANISETEILQEKQKVTVTNTHKDYEINAFLKAGHFTRVNGNVEKSPLAGITFRLAVKYDLEAKLTAALSRLEECRELLQKATAALLEKMGKNAAEIKAESEEVKEEVNYQVMEEGGETAEAVVEKEETTVEQEIDEAADEAETEEEIKPENSIVLELDNEILETEKIVQLAGGGAAITTIIPIADVQEQESDLGKMTSLDLEGAQFIDSADEKAGMPEEWTEERLQEEWDKLAAEIKELEESILSLQKLKMVLERQYKTDERGFLEIPLAELPNGEYYLEESEIPEILKERKESEWTLDKAEEVDGKIIRTFSRVIDPGYQLPENADAKTEFEIKNGRLEVVSRIIINSKTELKEERKEEEELPTPEIPETPRPYDPKPEEPKPDDPKPEIPKPEEPEPEIPVTEIPESEIPEGSVEVNSQPEEEVIEEEIPLGVPELPKTDGISGELFLMTGLIFLAFGITFKRK